MKYLTTENAKTVHGEELGVLTGILYLSPEVANRICPYASDYCKALCLVNSGMAEVFPKINRARARKTHEYLADPKAFAKRIETDIRLLERQAKRKGMACAVRLNGTSDILFERLIDLASFPGVQFYDYTKVPLQFRRPIANYHLTFSFSGENWEECEKAIDRGFNVAMVFARDLPAEYKGLEVVDGTTHDVRFLDAIRGGIVGLCAKGRKARLAAKQGSPFIVSDY